MAYVTIPGGMYFPDLLQLPVSNGSVTLDTLGEQYAVMFYAPKTGSLSKVRFRMETTTVGDTLKVSFQDRDPATGDPDGVVDQFRTIVVSSSDDNVWLQTGIISSDGTNTGTKRSVTQGDRIFIVFEFNSYVAGNMSISDAAGLVAADNDIYTSNFVAAAWTKGNGRSGCLEVEYSDGSIASTKALMPGINDAFTGLNTGSTPDEVALIFQVPFACKANGAFVYVDADGPFDIVLYDSDGTTALTTVSYASPNRSDTGVSATRVAFTGDVTLLASTSYRLAIKPTSGTNISTRYFDVGVAATLDTLGGGQACHWSERTNAGSWTETTTRRMRAAVLISAIDTGGGGGTVYPFIIG